MSAQQPTQDDPQIPGSEDSGKDQLLCTRYYYFIMTTMIVADVIIGIATFIGIITNAEGRVCILHLVFILLVAGALTIDRFADTTLAEKSPHLVPGYAAPYFRGGQVSQQGQYGQSRYEQSATRLMASQSTSHGQVPDRQVAQGAPWQAPHSQPQQQGQMPPSDQYGQDSQNQQPHGQGGQPRQGGPVGY